MGFLQPLALLGLAAASIPLLLHLWRQRLPPIVEFPAVRYLAETARQHSRTLKLHHLLLLLLRTLLIVAVVMAASRPVMNRRIPGVAGAHPPTAIALVVDNSFSSQTVRAGQPSVDEFRALARDLLIQLTPADHLWIVLADGLPRRTTLSEAHAVLDSLAPWPIRLDLSAAVAQARAVLDADELDNAEIHVLSDFQRSALSGPGEGLTPILGVELEGDPPPNRGVSGVLVADPLWRDDGGSIVVVAGGSGAAESAPVTVGLGDGPERRTVLAPGQSSEVRLASPRPGWWIGEVEFTPDELRGDDRGYFAVRVAPPARVNVSAAAGPFLRDAIAVLAAAGRVIPGVGVTIDSDAGSGPQLLVPPEDPARIGALNRSLAQRGIPWRLEANGTAGLVDSSAIPMLGGADVRRRYRLVSSGPARDVLATVNGEPWIVRSGDVVLLASRFNEAWTDLPVRPGFVVALDYLLNRTLRGEIAPVEAAPGDRVRVPDRVTALSGLGADRSVEPGGFMTAPTTLGAFFLLGGADTIGTLSVNADPRESDLARASRREIRAALGEPSRVVSAADYAQERLASVQQAELASIFIVLAIALAIAELVASGWGGRGAGDASSIGS